MSNVNYYYFYYIDIFKIDLFDVIAHKYMAYK